MGGGAREVGYVEGEFGGGVGDYQGGEGKDDEGGSSGGRRAESGEGWVRQRWRTEEGGGCSRVKDDGATKRGRR